MTNKAAPLIIAHRGASGRLPEHTMEGYRLAAQLGADVIEPDLVFTKDGHLICRHDRYLSTTTDVADKPEFADRARKEPRRKLDWYAEDFTLEEIKTLKARQAFPGRSKAEDDLYDISTFEELLSEAKAKGWRLCPEAKDPQHAFLNNGHDFRAALWPFFEAAGRGDIGASFIQCFDPGWLQTIPKLANIERVQLFYQDDSQPEVFDIATVVDHCEAIGPNKDSMVHAGGSMVGAGRSPLFRKAKDLGLKIYPWTYRDDYLPGFVETPEEEYLLHFEIGVDGVFSDFTGSAIAARNAWLQQP